MSDTPLAAAPLSDVIERSGIPFPNPRPYEHITFTCVAWNEAHRLPQLLQLVRPVFQTLAVAVQESSDDTLAIAREYADVVVEDEHRGYGDATFGPKLLPAVQTPWVLKLDADEIPSDELLASLSSATWAAADGAWIPFRSAVEGIEYEEQHCHLRLFRTKHGWPPYLHSRPPIEHGVLWHTGFIRHDRSLRELLVDYLRYWAIGHGNSGWDTHNRSMMWHACTGTAAVKGWEFVKALDVWPRVQEIAFDGKDPQGGTNGS
jgi:hypothetical protein